MSPSFQQFLDSYLEAWRTSSINKMKDIISRDYKAREITGGEIVDFGYEESMEGWEEGFHFVRENNAQWVINIISKFSLRVDERLVVVSATMLINGKPLETANLFFQTFKRNCDDDWKLIRSYIEAGITNNNIIID